MSLRFSLALLLMVAMSQLVQQVEGRKKLCGDALNEALDMICVNAGFSRRFRRDTDRSPRSPEEAMLRKWRLLALRQQLDQPEEPHPMAIINEASDNGELRRPRRRIIQACCLDGCTYDEIREYCA
ncbi:hypothetical protein ACLKA6_011000 [Drosophila palustris]